jgi:hypothetical protein
MELEDPKDLRARFRKFLNLTNERKKMSKTTIRKRIALTATTALFAGMLSIASTPVAQAHNAVGAGTNTAMSVGTTAGLNAGTVGGSLFVSVIDNATTSAASAIAADSTAGCAGVITSGKSKGLLYKDSSSGIAQSATVLAGGVLSLYSCVATAVSFQASAGSLVASGGAAAQTGWEYNSSNTKVWSANITAATQVGALWTAPATVGTYTVSLYSGFYTNSSGASVIATAALGATPATLAGNITVSVVAASAGGTFDASNSFCKAVRGTTANPANNIDDSSVPANGGGYSIDFALRDAYNANLSSSGAIVVNATNGAKVALGTAGATPVAGTASSVVTTGNGSNSTVYVTQATAGAPVTTTVTISYNGTTVCTKTVSIAGTVAALTVPAANIAVQDLSASTGSAAWFAGDTRTGTFYVVATDSAGNRIATPTTLGTYGYVDGSTNTIVTDIAFAADELATSTSSTSPLSATVGTHTCSATAGKSSNVKVKFTLANGTVITSAPFTLECADDAATYTAGFDKASYVSGDVAKLTVSFKDAKGNVANNVSAASALSVIAVPGMTLVSATGSATAVLKQGGKFEYTYTVGQNAGKYAAVVDFTGSSTTLATYATVQNPSYSISTGGDSTTNADVLKSIVALIASINKQIQALQKLILKR